jgi:hypothetical protein
VTPTFSSRVVMLKNTTHQWGAKGDWMLTGKDTVTLRYSWSTSDNVVPISILGADIPGFPVGDHPTSHLAAVSHVRTVSPQVVHNLRASFFRHDFLMEKRLSGLSPRSLGFGYDTSLEAAKGAPFMLVHGYSSVGDPAIGPRDTVQNNYEVGETITITSGAHIFRFGGRIPPHPAQRRAGAFQQRRLPVFELPHEQQPSEPAARTAVRLHAGGRRLPPRPARLGLDAFRAGRLAPEAKCDAPPGPAP